MREYAFERVAVLRRREGLTLEHDYREVIRRRAAEGWEFVQAMSFEAHTDARIELVFTRKGKK